MYTDTPCTTYPIISINWILMYTGSDCTYPIISMNSHVNWFWLHIQFSQWIIMYTGSPCTYPIISINSHVYWYSLYHLSNYLNEFSCKLVLTVPIQLSQWIEFSCIAVLTVQCTYPIISINSHVYWYFLYLSNFSQWILMYTGSPCTYLFISMNSHVNWWFSLYLNEF